MKIEQWPAAAQEQPRTLAAPLDVPAVAARYMHHVRQQWFVRELPSNGADYGYVTDYDKAVAMSPYWQRRFRAYVRRCSQHDGVSFFPAR